MSNWNKNKDYKDRFGNMLDSFLSQDFEALGREMRKWGKQFREDMKDFTKENDFDTSFGQDAPSGMPLVNVLETKSHFRIELLAPGLQKEDFKLNLNGQEIHIKVDTESQSKAGEQYKKKEFSFDKFERTVKLPKEADLNKIDAKYEQGILTITIDKKAEAKDKGIEIKVG